MNVQDQMVRWLTRKEAAHYLCQLGFSMTPRTLEGMAANNNSGKGPAFTRFGWRTVRYLKEDLDSWAKSRKTRVG
jgi:hypothetical protein